MKNILITVLFALTLIACNGVDSSANKTPVDTKADDAVETTAFTETEASVEILPPVETNDANTDYQPAFEGQTRIAGVETVTPYEVRLLAEGLSSPWGIAVLP